MDPKLSHSLAKFAFRFCNELDKSQTTVCSPVSSEILLAIIALASTGQSRAELIKALEIADDDDAIRSSFALVMSALQSIKGVTFSMANKVYIKEGYKLKPNIKKDVEEAFQSSLELIDFMEKERAADTINKWVAQKTNGLIKDIITPESFEKKTRLVLVNAIYFKGDWRVPFMEKNTQNRDFHVNNSTTIQVPTMCRSEAVMKFGVIPALKAKVLEAEYEGNEASMVIVLPDDVEGLSSVLQQLVEGHDLMADVAALSDTKVHVRIPKFKVEKTIHLTELLPKLGIKTILDEYFTQIYMLTSGENMVVSEAIQKVYIDVNETGTEAAACTIKVTKRVCKRGKTPPQFIADRPFLYLLVTRGFPLFVGVYEGSQFAVATTTAT